MRPKRTCEICGRTYKMRPTEEDGTSEFGSQDSSYALIRLIELDHAALYVYDTCPHCALELIWKIKTMKRKATKKCDFCEHDLGPKHPDYRKTCFGCSNYNHFELRKRMSDTQSLHWRYFNGEMD